jgi:hypothetical protein
MQGIGLDVPSRSLGYAHTVLGLGLGSLAFLQPRTWLRNLSLGAAFLVTLYLPATWVGPLWDAPAESARFVWGFYLTFAMSLGMPFAAAAIVLTFLARRTQPVSPSKSLFIVLGAYLAGILASFPVSFNYSLLYPLIR